MAISGDLKLLGTFVSYPSHHLRPSLSSSKASFAGFSIRAPKGLKVTPKWPEMESQGHGRAQKSYRCSGIRENKLAAATIDQDTEGFLLNAVNMNFYERLSLAWKILFPKKTARMNSNAQIAKQRLKMILFSDRCAVSDEAKQKIVRNIIQALSDFVEIDSQDKVQLSVSTDPDLGTVYSVTVPVRRVKPEYQESEEHCKGKITGIEYKDTGETSGTVDVKFDFYLPNDNWSSGY